MKSIKCVRETRKQKLKFTFVLGPTTILHMNLQSYLQGS